MNNHKNYSIIQVHLFKGPYKTTIMGNYGEVEIIVKWPKFWK